MGYTQANVQIKGLNEAVAGLKAMGAEKEIQKLNQEIGNRVLVQVRPLVPVQTGHLLGSLRTSRSAKTVSVLAGKDPSIPYANPQNWGWFYDRKNMQAKNIKPQQFMNKGAAKVRPWIQANYIQRLIALFEKYSLKN